MPRVYHCWGWLILSNKILWDHIPGVSHFELPTKTGASHKLLNPPGVTDKYQQMNMEPAKPSQPANQPTNQDNQHTNKPAKKPTHQAKPNESNPNKTRSKQKTQDKQSKKQSTQTGKHTMQNNPRQCKTTKPCILTIKQSNKQTNKQASKQASKQARQETDKQTSRRKLRTIKMQNKKDTCACLE